MTVVNHRNLVNSSGVVAGDVTGAGTARANGAACEYGGDKAIYAYGSTASSLADAVSLSNLINNSGVIASDTTGVGTARAYVSACRYGGDKGIFTGGAGPTSQTDKTNLVNNSGVVATDSDSSYYSWASSPLMAEYGVGLGIKYSGSLLNTGVISWSHLITSSGTYGSNVSLVGSARQGGAGARYGT